MTKKDNAKLQEIYNEIVSVIDSSVREIANTTDEINESFWKGVKVSLEDQRNSIEEHFPQVKK